MYCMYVHVFLLQCMGMHIHNYVCLSICICMCYHVLLVTIDSKYQLCYNSVTSNSLSTDKEMGYDNKYFHNPSSQNHVYTFSCTCTCICIYVSIHISISSNSFRRSIHSSTCLCI